MISKRNEQLKTNLIYLAECWQSSDEASALRSLVERCQSIIVAPTTLDTPDIVEFARSHLANVFGESYASGKHILDPTALTLEYLLFDHDVWKHCTPGKASGYALADLCSKMIREQGVDAAEYPKLLPKISLVISQWSDEIVIFSGPDDVHLLHDTLFGKGWSVIFEDEISSLIDKPRTHYLSILQPPFRFARDSVLGSASLPDEILAP